MVRLGRESTCSFSWMWIVLDVTVYEMCGASLKEHKLDVGWWQSLTTKMGREDWLDQECCTSDALLLTTFGGLIQS